MLRVLPISAKLLLPIIAFGAIGLAVIPADLSAVHDSKTALTKTVAAPAVPSFNAAPLPVEAINKAPVIATPTPVAAQDLAPVPAALWRPAWVRQVATTTATEPPNLTLGQVNSAVNVRETGLKGSPVLFVLPAGASVRIGETQDGWVHVYSDQGAGWIYSSYLGERPPAAATNGALPSGQMIRVSGTVTVRDAPGGDPLYKLDAGESIRIVETEDGWARIVTATGEGGWVRVR